MHASSFPPVASGHCRVLILGSLPGIRSLQATQYYAHAQNAFWPIMQQVLGKPMQVPYARRLQLLLDGGVALWDVVSNADRIGSADANIRNVVANDFAAFFEVHPRIRCVCFNGQTAARIYKQRVLPVIRVQRPDLQYLTLPSTSPLHTVPLQDKLDQWLALRAHLSK